MMIFSLERAAVVWAILERISGFDSSLEMIAPRYLKFSTVSSLGPLILISVLVLRPKYTWVPVSLFFPHSHKHFSSSYYMRLSEPFFLNMIAERLFGQ